MVNRDGNIFGTDEMPAQNPFLGRLALILN